MNTTTQQAMTGTAGASGAAAERRDAQRDELPTTWLPVDVIEDPAGITLWADLPGVPKDKLHLDVDADTLTIQGEMQIDMPQSVESTHAEIAVPRYRRMFTLSKELDTQAVTAELHLGVLKLRIPKAQHAQPRKIEIRVG